MIFTDGSHLVSDKSLDELHLFARLIGLRHEWFQNHPRHPHYDITTSKKREIAFKKGAIFTSSKEIVKICKKLEK